MSIAELIRAMANAGATSEAIAIAVEAIESAGARVDADKAAARDRKRRQRAKERDGHVTVTGQSRDMDVTVTAEPLSLSPNENNSNPHTHTPEGDTPRPRKALAWPCPADVEPQHWADLMANRRTKRLTNTETAYRGQLAKLAELSDEEWPPGRLVRHAAEHGWAGIHDPRTSQDHRNGHRTRPSFHDRPSGWAPRPGMAGVEPASLDDVYGN